MNQPNDHIRRRFLQRLLVVSGGVLAGIAAPGLRAAENAQVKGLRLSAHDGVTRVVIDLSEPVEHSLFTLHEPERVVIDLKKAYVRDDLDLFTLPQSVVRGVRHASRSLSDLRVVLDLKGAVQPRSFLLRPDPASGVGNRLVIDLHEKGGAAPAPVISSVEPEPQQLRDVVIAIDAGHGGKDPGAIGRGGTREKDIVLSVARKLEALIKREPGMRPVMIRDGDYFLPLRERIARARTHKADLFISVHADASPDKRVHGSSVYILSQSGASSEFARILAERENASDLVGGVSLNDKDELLASVLLDLSQTATIEASQDLADGMLGELNQVAEVRRMRVEQAGFAVLKSPDIPSVLVETAFISNPAEERKLRTSAHQQKLAVAMLQGIREYFSQYAPPDSRLAHRESGPDRYVIRSGDTLSHIAERYQVSVSDLREANGLQHDRLKIGQVLFIPIQGS